MEHDYKFVYQPQKRRYVFETVPNCKTHLDTVDAFSKRTGISKKDCQIFFQYLREFIGDAVESNATIRLTGVFDLKYKIVKQRKLKDINGDWKIYKPIIKPYLSLPRRLRERGRMEISEKEYIDLVGNKDE